MFREFNVRYTHVFFIVIVIILLFTKAFVQFSPGADFIWYHLPNALMMIGWSDYTPSPYIQLVIDTFPPFADLMQGVLVAITGRVESSLGANWVVLSLSLLLIWANFRKGFSWRWYLTFLMAIPLVVMHATSGYVDLIGACGALLSFSALLSLNSSDRKFYLPAVTFIIGLLVANLSRFQLWPCCYLLIAAMTVVLWKHRTSLNLSKSLAFICISIIAASIWPAKNFIEYGNPTYPYRAPFIGKYFPSAITMNELYVNQVPKQLQDVPQPLIFTSSVFEISRFQDTDRRYRWSVDQTADGGIENPHFRMGGWSIYTMLILAVGVFSLLRKYRDVPILFVIILVTSVLSQSHELRYFMFIPMMLSFYLCFHLSKLSPKLTLMIKGLILISAFHTLEAARVYKIRHVSYGDVVPDGVREYWRAYEKSDGSRPLCSRDVYNGIYYTGPTMSEYPVVNYSKDRCDGYFLKEEK